MSQNRNGKQDRARRQLSATIQKLTCYNWMTEEEARLIIARNPSVSWNDKNIAYIRRNKESYLSNR